MLQHADLMRLLAEQVDVEPDDSSDDRKSISSKVIRSVRHGERTFAVGAEQEAEVKIGALLDLLQIQHDERSLRVAGDAVTLIVGASGGDGHSEVLAALGTLIEAYRGRERVRVLSE